MASYDEMKEAARREALGEQASKFYEMARPARLRMSGMDSGPVETPPSRDPLAGLPTDPRSAAELDARYAQVDRHLAAAEAARARIPGGAKQHYGMNSTPDYGDKYGVGTASAYTPGGLTSDSPYSLDDSYSQLEDLERRGLISIQPGMRSEISRVRGLAKGEVKARNEAAREVSAARKVSPMQRSYGRDGHFDEATLRRPPGVGPYSEPKKKK
jgi:hypothetical protein